MIKKYLRIWLKMTGNSFATILSSRFGMVIFLFGKLFRLALYFAFIYFLFSGTTKISGYDQNQVLLFLISFAFLSAVGQMFFREAYRFRPKLVSGDFDFDLVKPIHPLFKNLAGGFDLLDLLTMPIIIYALLKIISLTNISPVGLILYTLLLVNGFLILLAIHILVMAFGIITTEVDHILMVYRDIETMGRFPVDIYKEPLRQLLIFIIPIGVVFTFPVKALLGELSWQTIFFSLTLGLASLYIANQFWNYSIKKYSSASS